MTRAKMGGAHRVDRNGEEKAAKMSSSAPLETRKMRMFPGSGGREGEKKWA